MDVPSSPRDPISLEKSQILRLSAWLRLVPATGFIAFVTIAASAAYWAAAHASPRIASALDLWLANSPHLVTGRLWFWQLVTANLIHGGLVHLGVNVSLLLWLGPPVERVLGSRQFVLFYFGAGIFAYLAYDIMAQSLPDWGTSTGASGSTLAVATLYTFCFPRRVIYLYGVLRAPLWSILLLLVLSDISSLLLGDGIPWINNAVHLGGVAFAVAYWGLLARTV